MRLSRQIFSYSIFNIANAAVPFLLLPILTTYLLPKEFGILSLVMMLQALLLPFVLINFQGLITIEYTKLTQNQFKRFLSSIIWLPVLGFFIVAPFLCLFSKKLATLFSIPEYWVTVSSVFVFLQALPLLLPVLFQARQQLMAYGIFKIGITIMSVLLSLYFLIWRKAGWEGRMWGMLGAFLFFNFVSLIILFREKLLSLEIDPGYFREAIKFGIPLIPHAISGIMLSMADRVFLVNLLSKEAVGIYSVAYQIASAVMIIMSSINQAWVPHLFAQLNNSPSAIQKRTIVIQTYKIMVLMLIGSLIFSATIPIIYKLFISGSYHGGITLAMLMSLAFLFQGFYFMVTNYIFYVKKPFLLSIMTITSAGAVMVLNYLLIPIYGVFGSVYAMLISWLLLFLLTWWLAQRLYPMPWGMSNKRVEI